MKFKLITTAAALSLCASMTLQAAVSAEEVARLGADLTPTGAEKAANADGSIPAWTGAGVENPPANFDPSKANYSNPFAEDKVLYTITRENMGEYDALLSEGQKALLEKWGSEGYRIDVYPSHRTFTAPQWFYDGSKLNAAGATLEADGQKIVGGAAGVPFPIPQNGLEALWNHMIRWMGYEFTFFVDSYYVNSSGKPVLASTNESFWEFPMYMPKVNPDRKYSGKNLSWGYLRNNTAAPARRAGEILLVHEPGADYTGGKGRSAWQYLTGQRRVRKAPSVSFDSPAAASAGTTTFDDSYMYNGSPERFNWKLVGKKEMLVPYNNYDALFKYETTEMLDKHIRKPGLVRFEKHRVWIVEGTLKDGERHVYSKRRYLLDEDSWAALEGMRWDRKDNLWRVAFAYQAQLWDIPAPLSLGLENYDLESNIYTLTGKPKPGSFKSSNGEKLSFFTAQGMSRGGIR